MMIFMEDDVYKEFIVYDAKDKVLGRLASTVAKDLLKGRSVVVVNADKAFISGSKSAIVARYKVRLGLQEKENPEHSPHWPRRPDMFVRRIIRGMLPYHKKPSGKAAFKRLRVFSGVPAELATRKPAEIKTKEPKSMYVGYLYIGELSKLLGYNRK